MDLRRAVELRAFGTLRDADATIEH